MTLPEEILRRAGDILATAPASGRKGVRENARSAVLSMREGTPVLTLRINPRDEWPIDFTFTGRDGVVTATQLDRNMAATDHFRERDARMAQALIAWAGPALADAPVDHSAPIDERLDMDGLRELIGLVALGPSRNDGADILRQVTARAEAQDDFTQEWLGGELCLVLRDFGLLSHFDWNTDEVAQSLANLHHRIGVRGVFRCEVDDELDGLDDALAAYSGWARARGYAVLSPESGMDSVFVVVTRFSKARRALELFEQLGAPAAVIGSLDGPLRRLLNRFRRRGDRT